jgi:acetolactate synthase-1/2/3 large subunit
MPSVAEAVVERPEAGGVTRDVGLASGDVTHLVEAWSRSSTRSVPVCREQDDSSTAEVSKRLDDRAGVCPVTLGSGAIDLLVGAADAVTSSAPLVALSAQAGVDPRFEACHLGVDLVSRFEPAPRSSALVATHGVAPEMIRVGFKRAHSERPGAVCRAVAIDIEKPDERAGATSW